MNILAFDTCFNKCSAAIISGTEVLSFKAATESNKQAEMLVDIVDECLVEADILLKDIDNICVTNGPGTFTGVRIGLACAHGLAIGSGLDIKCLSTFKVAWHAFGMTPVCVVFRAARGRYYVQKFDDSGVEIEPKLILENELSNYIEGYKIIGNVQDILDIDMTILPDARLTGFACNYFLQNNLVEFFDSRKRPIYLAQPDAYVDRT